MLDVIRPKIQQNSFLKVMCNKKNYVKKDTNKTYDDALKLSIFKSMKHCKNDCIQFSK